MSLQSLRYFIEIAHHLSFSEASRSLHISQPGLSQQISDLENRLGFKLLNRTTRKVTLTEEGRYIYNKLATSFEEIEQTIDDMIKHKMIPKAKINIAAVPSAASTIIPKLLKKVITDFPEVEFYTHETPSANAINLIKQKKFHLSFIRTPINKVDVLTKELNLFEFKKYPLQLIVSSNHPLANRESINLEEAKNEFFIHYSDQQTNSLQFLLEKACLNTGFSPKKLCTGSALLSIYNLISNNLGVALMPSDMAALLESSKVKVLKINNLELYSSISVVWNRENASSLTNHILNILQNEPLFSDFL